MNSTLSMLPALLAVLLSITQTSQASAAALPQTADPKLEFLTGGDKALSKMSSALLQMRRETAAGKPLQPALARIAPWAQRGAKIQVIIGANALNPGLFMACKRAGIEIVSSYSDANLHQIMARCDDPRQLDLIARRSDVRVITHEPRAFLQTGVVTSGADESIRAALARSTHGINGSGVRVGVISDSFHRVIGGTLAGGILTGSDSQNSGDLPSTVRIIDPGPVEGADEGAGMAELICDLAPGCAISFASAFSGYYEFAANIRKLADDPGYKCNVMVDDVLYTSEPMYQDGPIAQAYKDACSSGVACFSSAGNYSNTAHEWRYYDADAATSEMVYPPTGVDFHDFGAAYEMPKKTSLAMLLFPGSSMYLCLHWDEPYGGGLAAGPGAQADLDLYVLSDDQMPVTKSKVLAQSITRQGTTGAPAGDAYEELEYTNNDMTSDYQIVYAAIDHYDGRTTVNLHLLAIGVGLAGLLDTDYAADRTVFGHTAAASVMSVAAMDCLEIDYDGYYQYPEDELNAEYFTSYGGPLPFWFSDDGLTRYKGAMLRSKPDITAPDGANTSFFGEDTDMDGYPNFYGTSAAAPHAAAVAALMLSKNPNLTPEQLYAHMRSTTREAESPGWDAISGWGLIDALNAVNAAVPATVADWTVY
ncbi:MAG: S8 family serine peptidase [Candidatus Sumerlaeota bacterium]|nr:S8 family serine peptidase [Candidatus Sumerlaeota bacterium]